MNTDHALVFIVYGGDETYYNGAKFSILSFLSHVEKKHWPHVLVLAEKSEYFSSFPIEVHRLEEQWKESWTCNGQYHFRIKNRGLKHIIEKADNSLNKFLFLDADTYFNYDPSVLFELISDDRSLLFYPEENVYLSKPGSEYYKLKGLTLPLKSGQTYQVTKSSVMWNSGVIGLSRKMLDVLDDADEFILAMMDSDCNAHTIEQFALSEALNKYYEILPAKDKVAHYSTSGRKDWARVVLERFFIENGNKSFEEQVQLAKKVSFTRPLSEVIRGHIYKKKKKLRQLFGLKPE